MPILHNYVTVDTKAFLSDPKHLECVFKMIKHVNMMYKSALFSSQILQSF